MKLNKELLNKVSKIVGWKYEEDLIQEEIEDMIEDLIFRYEELKEDMEELEEDVKYNYVPASDLELIGMSEEDFF